MPPITDDDEQRLLKKFPSFFRELAKHPPETPLGFDGLEVGAGWLRLIRDTCEQLTATDLDHETDFHFTQIKEKEGKLRMSFRGGSERMRHIVARAEEKSATICELCGSQKNVLILPWMGSWVKALCKKCRKDVKKGNS